MKRKDISYEAIKALTSFPYFILKRESENNYGFYTREVAEIKQNYIDYQTGADFTTEGSSGDYVPSDIHFKNASNLIDREARFMFSQTPDIYIKALDTDDISKNSAEQYQILVQKVLEKSNFSSMLIKAAKDCFIGKRVAALVDYSESDGIQIHFYDSLSFYYETDYGSDRLKKFVSFDTVEDDYSSANRRYLVNKYEDIDDVIYFSSILYTGAGTIVEEIIPYGATSLNYIPAKVIINDGTLQQKRGVSEIAGLVGFESGYSKLSNADVDSERKGMNPVRYVVDMNSRTTKNLSSCAGSFWELKSEQNQNNVHPSVGTLAPQMTHTEAVKTTLDRLKTAMHDAVDVPDISKDGLLSGITSFKALKGLYYPLTVRCNEKLKTWKPALHEIVSMIIDIALLNRDYVLSQYKLQGLDDVQYTIEVEENWALLDDETEEKETDLAEIAQMTRSRKSYIKKWRGSEFKTEEQIDEELMQIAIENAMFDSASVPAQVQMELDRRAMSDEIDATISLLSETEENE